MLILEDLDTLITPKNRSHFLNEMDGFADNTRMPRTKRKLSSRPKYKQTRRLKDRKMKAKKAASHKRGLGRSKARRRRRGTTKKK